MSSAPPTLSRRHVLAGGALLALLGVAAPACGSAPEPAKVDDLESQRRLARDDSELATAAAAVAPPAMVAALIQIAAERAEHARVLAVEIARVTGESEPASTGASEPTAAGEPSGPAPTVYEVAGALRAAADSAGGLATDSSGYRAGLLASIAAACTAAHDVALVMTP